MDSNSSIKNDNRANFNYHKKLSFFNICFILFAKFCVSLRYRLKIKGLDEIKKKGNSSILFLANHPALIDPVLLLSVIYSRFKPITLADEYQVNRPLISSIAKRFNVLVIPNLERGGAKGRDDIIPAVDKLARMVSSGENALIYPAGHLKHSKFEELGASSSVDLILKKEPETRVVIIRQNGLWGSSFSYGFDGKPPVFMKSLLRGIKYIFLNAIFFIPKREVSYEFIEPAGFPKQSGKLEINRYLENIFNENARGNIYVPYSIFEQTTAIEKPDPPIRKIEGDPDSIPEATRKIIIDKLKDITAIENIKDTDKLNSGLGLDSLSIVELMAWIESEFGFSAGSPEALKTVGDVMLASVGRGISAIADDIKPPGIKWNAIKPPSTASMRHAVTITEAFINKAKQNPNQVIIADQISGEKTYRDIILSIFILKKYLKAIDGVYCGIMLPSSVTATILYLASLFSGKIPVMVNWTIGVKAVKHSLGSLNVDKVVTSKSLIAKLRSKGIILDDIEGKFIFLEDIKLSVKIKDKIKAVLKSRLNWSLLAKNDVVPETAVILFTSGSESTPKAVPLSHSNILSNISDILKMVKLKENDCLFGFLPPFHSFGLTVTSILPLCLGIKSAYYPVPTDSAQIAKLIEAYGVTILPSTPSFLNGILRASDDNNLKTLRMAVTGAEKCPEHIYERAKVKNPSLVFLEGYGISECSPIVSVNPESAPKAGTIGKMMPSLEYVILDTQNWLPVKQGSTGMLFVRGTSVFSGYINYDGDSPFVDFNGKQWYKTGDLVSESADRYLTFQGRLKRFVKLGGEMISLPAIESAIATRISLEEDNGASFAVEADSNQDNPEITLFCLKEISREYVNNIIRQSGLSPLHNIRKIIVLPAIPMLGNGKTDYRKLKEMLQTDN